MSNPHLSAVLMDPYQWRESVLSTRSLSYLSTADALGSRSRSTSLNYPNNSNNNYSTSRRGTIDEESSDYGEEGDLEMADSNTERDGREAEVGGEGGVSVGGLSDIQETELPESVANCRIFTLPREIRDRIYALCLTAKEGLPVEWPHLPGANLTYALQPQLLRTCKLLYDECAPLLYSANTLTFHHPSDANMFVRAFASTTLSRRCITHVSLHIKSGDTRLWMPYLTSGDEYRSLKADFRSVREVGVRYRSNKWNHSSSPEQNLKNWCEDSRLDEIIDGLRHVYYPPLPPPPPPPGGSEPVSRGDGSDVVKPLNEMNEAEFMRFVDARRPGEDMAFKRQLLELHKAHAPKACRGEGRVEPPRVKVVCACRVHSAHFNLLTSPPSEGGGTGTGGGTAGAANTLAAHLPNPAALAAAVLPNLTSNDSTPAAPPTAVKEGEAFRGFTPLDFCTQGIKQLHDPDLGSAKVSRTPFADKNGILVALEIHCLDPKKDRERSADHRA